MGKLDSIKNFIEVQTIRGLIRIAPHLSDKTLNKFIKDEIARIPYAEGRVFTKKMMNLSKQFLKRVAPSVRKRAVNSFLINQFLVGSKKKEDYKKVHGYDPPFLFVISPTMRCNLGCYGCYAANYSKDDDLPTEIIDRVFNEAKKLGIYFVTVSGGEPFYREDILDIFHRHSDIYFQVYTNGTLIDDEKARKIVKLGNVLPCISVEGFEAETDARRGKGTFNRILQAMENLRKHKGVFGFSATSTRQNNELIVSDEFVEFFVQQGCYLGWYFNYIPIGRKPDMSLMPTPEQRIYRKERLVELRKKYPILLADFWNDGTMCGGCLAGGKFYFHINVRGEVEPCVFAHFAVDNIKDKSLVDILESPFFKKIRENQPFNKNHLRPCMIIDSPWKLREIVEEVGAHPTHQGAGNVIGELADELDDMAIRYGKLADEYWKTHYADEGGALEREVPAEIASEK